MSVCYSFMSDQTLQVAVFWQAGAWGRCLQPYRRRSYAPRLKRADMKHVLAAPFARKSPALAFHMK